MMKTPITYYGGKQSMLKHILPLIPAHSCYTEAFAGGAAVFFAKQRSPVEVINDLNGEIINFYQVVVSDFDRLKIKVEQTLHSRDDHKHAWYIYTNSNRFTKLERAWAVFTLSKNGFAGQLSSSFGFDKSAGRSAKKMFYAKDQFDLGLKERLECATIECDDALKVIRRFDTPEAFHFIDPPYIGSDMAHYNGMFNRESLMALLDCCSSLKGKFMLTMFPQEDIQNYVDRNGWVIHAIERRITACKKVSARRMQVEWMVCNY